MKVDRHISELLYDHDCVIVPAFGGFLASYRHAQVHPSQHTLMPPSKKIAFNIFLKQNDGLLANHIAGRDQISYNEALHNLELEVSRWMKELEAGHKLVIDRVGIFYLNGEKNVQFDPVKNINYLCDAFGLGTVQYLPVKREGYQERVEKQLKKTAAIRPSSKNEKRPTAFSWKTKKKVLTTLIVSGTLLWFSVNLYLISPRRPDLSSLNPFMSIHKTEVLKKENIPSKQVPAVKESTAVTSPAVEPAPETKTETASVAANRPETTPATSVQLPGSTSEEQKYFIIGGAFQVVENAETFVKTLQSEGFADARILDSPNRLTMVCYSGFSGRAEAVRELDRLKSLNKNGWIYAR